MMWRYFIHFDECGEAYELFRFPANGKDLLDQDDCDVYKCLKGGVWSGDEKMYLMVQSIGGHFNEAQSEISEAEALRLIEKWSAASWPT